MSGANVGDIRDTYKRFLGRSSALFSNWTYQVLKRVYRSNPAPFDLMPQEQKTLTLARFHPTLPDIYRLNITVMSDSAQRDVSFSSFTMEGSTSGFDIPEETTTPVSVTPNPVTGTDAASVNITGHGGFTVSLHDILGRQVSDALQAQAEGTTTVPLSVGGQAAGLYMVRVVAESGEVLHIPLHIHR